MEGRGWMPQILIKTGGLIMVAAASRQQEHSTHQGITGTKHTRDGKKKGSALVEPAPSHNRSVANSSTDVGFEKTQERHRLQSKRRVDWETY